jgi:hypothetical protein
LVEHALNNAARLIHEYRLPDPERERRPVAAPELRMGGVQREAPATNVATM